MFRFFFRCSFAEFHVFSNTNQLLSTNYNYKNYTNILVKKYGKKNNLKFSLKKPVPIHLVYLTAEIDHVGLLRLYDDGYGRDKMLAATFINPMAMHYEVML